MVGVGEGVEVFLGGGDSGVAHAVHDGFDVGAAGEEPGGVGVAEVVDADLEVDPRSGDGGSPHPSAERVPGDGGAVAGGEQQVTRPEPTLVDPVGELGDELVGQGHGAGFVVFGVGLGENGRRWGSS